MQCLLVGRGLLSGSCGAAGTSSCQSSQPETGCFQGPREQRDRGGQQLCPPRKPRASQGPCGPPGKGLATLCLSCSSCPSASGDGSSKAMRLRPFLLLRRSQPLNIMGREGATPENVPWPRWKSGTLCYKSPIFQRILSHSAGRGLLGQEFEEMIRAICRLPDGRGIT